MVKGNLCNGWGDIYADAPSEACRRYIEHILSAEMYDAEEYKAIRSDLERSLNRRDWLYLADNSKDGPRRMYYRNMCGV